MAAPISRSGLVRKIVRSSVNLFSWEAFEPLNLSSHTRQFPRCLHNGQLYSAFPMTTKPTESFEWVKLRPWLLSRQLCTSCTCRRVPKLSSRQTPAFGLHRHTLVLTRQSSKSLGSHREDKLANQNAEKENVQLQEQRARWVLRTGHENVYLSWQRNALISTMAGVTIYAQDRLPLGKEAAIGLFLVGIMSYSIGVFGYVTSSISLRKVLRLSAPALIWQCSHSTFTLLLLCCAIAFYIGLVEDDVSDATDTSQAVVEV